MGFLQCRQGREGLKMRTSALLGAKNFEYFEIYVCPQGQGALEESIFHDFVQTFFTEGTLNENLRLVPYNTKNIPKVELKYKYKIMYFVFLITNTLPILELDFSFFISIRQISRFHPAWQESILCGKQLPVIHQRPLYLDTGAMPT